MRLKEAKEKYSLKINLHYLYLLHSFGIIKHIYTHRHIFKLLDKWHG